MVDLTNTAQRQWVRANPEGSPAEFYVEGVVTGRSGAWTHVSFVEKHPEISGIVSCKAGKLVPLATNNPNGSASAPRSAVDRRNAATLEDYELEPDEDVDDAAPEDFGTAPPEGPNQWKEEKDIKCNRKEANHGPIKQPMIIMGCHAWPL